MTATLMLTGLFCTIIKLKQKRFEKMLGVVIHTGLHSTTRPERGPDPKPDPNGAGRVRHFKGRVFSGRVCWHVEIRVFFGSIPEKVEETRTF